MGRSYLVPEHQNPGVVEMYMNLHEMILRLAGRIPDEKLAKIRATLHEGDWQMTGAELEAVAFTYKVLLPTQGMTQLPRRVTEPGWQTNKPLEPAGDFNTVLPLKNYTFTPFPPQYLGQLPANWLDLLDISAGEPAIPYRQLRELYGWDHSPLVPGLGPDDGVTGIWQSWRSGPDPDSPVKRIYIIELHPKADPSEYESLARTDLTIANRSEEQLLEAYRSGWELPEYHRRAQFNGVLVWARYPGTVHVVAESGGRAGARVPGTDFSTDGLVVWPGPGNGELSTVDDVAKFRAFLALRKAGKVA
ncbi:hypothetical protein [Catelliglobosispora koreensis]|uniref:hypothetical protein n=1 Tax=Catelliglobosispora koreensis TaxID=129052 RepID=UPI0012FBE21E|nr:hypothetical protein [Catelliglobosispora koreensis]